MKGFRNGALMAGILAVVLFGCAGPIPRPVKERTIAFSSLKEIIDHPETFRNRSIVAGGYVLEVKNEPNRSVVTALRVPLGHRDAPRQRDLSDGRLEIFYNGFLDPEIFEKDRKITVAGTVLGSSADAAEASAIPFVRLQAERIHLWPEPPPVTWGYDPFWDDFMGYDPFWRHRHPRWRPYPFW